MTVKKSTKTESNGMTVPKTYKLYVGGKFPRSESGRTFEVKTANGDFLANVSRASRKDARDAVTSARAAFGGWSGATAYNRGQVLYRVAEMLDGRRGQFVSELTTALGSSSDAEKEVDEAIATWIYYAGFSDKYQQVLGSSNPVAAPYFNFSIPEATGVVASFAAELSPLSGVAAALAPVIVSGNTCVLVASDRYPTVAISFAEVLNSSDVPGGVVNILTGHQKELAPVLAAHMDVNAINAGAVQGVDRREIEVACVENLKRVGSNSDSGLSIDQIAQFIEMKTVWHPIGV